MSFSPPRVPPPLASKAIKYANEQGNQFVNQMEEVLDLLKENISNSNAKYEEQANRNRMPAPAYRVGDLVFLSTRNMNSPRPIKKLDNKYIGPFKIKSVLGSHTYSLDLPYELTSIDNSFYTSLFQPVPKTLFPGQNSTQDKAIMIDDYGEKLWAIDKIINCSRHKGMFQYHIIWRDSNDITWVPLQNVMLASKVVKEFQDEYPKMKKPNNKDIAKAKQFIENSANLSQKINNA